jgi:hypothetical protein
MKVRRVNSILWLTAVCCLALGALSLVLGFALPLDVAPAEQTSATVPVRTPTTKPAIESFEQITSRSFRGPLNDDAAAIKSAGAPPTTAMQSSTGPVLVGTIGDSLAMFRMPDGSIALKGVGDDLEGSSVIAIRPEQVDLLSNGKRATMSKLKPQAPPGVSLEGGNP